MFSDGVAVDLVPGGEAVLIWDEHGSYRTRVEKVDPPHSFSFRWVRRIGVDPREGNAHVAGRLHRRPRW